MISNVGIETAYHGMRSHDCPVYTGSFVKYVAQIFNLPCDVSRKITVVPKKKVEMADVVLCVKYR